MYFKNYQKYWIPLRAWSDLYAHAEHTGQEIKWCLALQKIKVTSLYFSPKVTNPEMLYGVKIMKIQTIENLILGHL